MILIKTLKNLNNLNFNYYNLSKSFYTRTKKIQTKLNFKNFDAQDI